MSLGRSADQRRKDTAGVSFASSLAVSSATGMFNAYYQQESRLVASAAIVSEAAV
jgi:hypothetical protein